MKINISIVISVLACLYSCNGPERPGKINSIPSANIDSTSILKTRIDILLFQIDSLKDELDYWFSEQDIAGLKEKKLIDPLKDITDKLRDTPALIPYPGVLGGTMRFDKITLLGNRWVIADFDDGHVMGKMLLRYSVRKDTSLKWTILDKYMD